MSYIILNYIDRIFAGYDGPVCDFVAEQEEMIIADDAYNILYYLMDDKVLSEEQARKYWHAWKAVNL